MAFEKTQTAVSQRERYNIYDPIDKNQILSFEKELKPYLSRQLNIFGKVLKGIDLYFHKKGMFSYSPRYKEGAVIMERLEEYRLANLKYQALRVLQDMRDKAEAKERERIQTLGV